MEIHELREMCINGSQAYLDWLAMNNRGLEEIPVVAKHRGETGIYELRLAKRLFDPENILLEDRRNDRAFGINELQVVEYDADVNLLIVRFKSSENHLEEVDAEHLFVISDLKFLVSNVKEWFVRNGMDICPPAANNQPVESLQRIVQPDEIGRAHV